MKSIIKKIIEWIRIFPRTVYFSIGEKKVECPICSWKGRSFLSFGVKKRDNALCPRCYSLERHRLLYLYFKDLLTNEIKTEVIKVLHFAPEKSLSRLFKSFEHVGYLSVDIIPGFAMKVEDITKLTFKDNTFDIICCSHILEHIADDMLAMSELRRVLVKNGKAILQVPIFDRDDTYEDFSITSENEREKIFGQKDHVRMYGRDFIDRLKKAGFTMTPLNYCHIIGEEQTKKYALLPNNGDCAPTEGVIYIGTK